MPLIVANFQVLFRPNPALLRILSEEKNTPGNLLYSQKFVVQKIYTWSLPKRKVQISLFFLHSHISNFFQVSSISVSLTRNNDVMEK